MKVRSFLFALLSICLFNQLQGQKLKNRDIPKVHKHMYKNDTGLYILVGNEKYYEIKTNPEYTLGQMRDHINGNSNGLEFSFEDPGLQGKLYYGFIPFEDYKYPLPVYFRKDAEISEGKAEVSIADLAGRYDMIGWEQKEKGTLGYRICDAEGGILYDGRISFKGTGPFQVDVSIVEGPFVDFVSEDGAVISFETNTPVSTALEAGGKKYTGKTATHHEFHIEGLQSSKEYSYSVFYGKNKESYSFKTAPEPGSRKPFIFSYASDSRSGSGGGERDLGGTNGYIVKKIMALNACKGVAFAQFTGDLITGYAMHEGEMQLEYSNWKRTVEPFAHYFPVIPAIGNHEALVRIFQGEKSKRLIYLDKFPFKTQSAEQAFSKAFVTPGNGPVSEDGASYDPSEKTDDFPPYGETVYYYTYDNVAMIALNSDYWYAPSTPMVQYSGGNIHGYVMDNQLAWLKETLEKLESDGNIDHIFVTIHTPFFPNGGHVQDDMWYNGNNGYRPVVAGKRLGKGIIERRDELLDLIVNKSKKVRAILTGDEHNYCKTEVGPETNIYPETYFSAKISLSRTIYQINNGAAGAPYYAQQQTPWTPFTSGFTTQNALVLFHVNGMSIDVEVLNPDTLEEVDRFKLH